MKIFKRILGFVCALCAISASAQHPVDTIARRNTIKLDLTSYVLYEKVAVLSYERVVKPHQTLGITIGSQQLPSLSSINAIQITRDTRARGVKVGTEYRFYLPKDNKYNAPRGVYIGPYLTVLNFANQRLLERDNNGTLETGTLTTNVNIINIGFQLGYQFLVRDRWTFDLVFVGPSASNYRTRVKLDGNISVDPDDISDEISDALLDRFPLIGDLISGNPISSSGKANVWGFGYRYQFQVGYHFGRRKK